MSGRGRLIVALAATAVSLGIGWRYMVADWQLPAWAIAVAWTLLLVPWEPAPRVALPGRGLALLIGLAVPLLWLALTVTLGGILLTGAPSSSHYTASIPALCWLVALPLGWLWERGPPRLALALVGALVATDLLFSFAIYVPGNPRDLVLPFPL